MTDVLLLAFLFLVAGVAAVPVAARLGLGSVLGYLIAGIAIAPVLAVLHVDVVSIQHFAEFGVVMMLFLIGLELQPRALWGMRGRLLGLGGGQVALTVLAVAGVAMLLGQPWTVGMAAGMVLALSSTAIALQTLEEKGLLKSDGGQASFQVLLAQDVAVIPMLAVIPLLALPELASPVLTHGAEEGHGAQMSLVAGLSGWQTTLVTLAAVAGVMLIGNFLSRPLFRFIAAARLRELFTATALMIVIGIALLMSLVGLSPALGTFLAGVVLANSEYRHELESDIAPFKGLLLGLFFMAVGASIDFALLRNALAVILGLTLALIALKAAVMFALAAAFRIRGADRWLVALGVAQAGEFGFVLLSFTVASDAMPAAIADSLLLVVALSMVLTPGLFLLYDRIIAPRFARGAEREADRFEAPARIIIAGRGRVGGIVDRMLKAAGHTPTVIDYSSAQLDALRRFGVKVHYGDATRPDLLHAAGIDTAKLLVVAIDGRAQITELVRYAIGHNPDLHVMARAVDRDHVYELWHAGCRDIIRETYDSSIRMGRSAYEALGTPRPKAERMAAEFDAMDRRALLETADHYDPDIPILENERYIAKIREILGPWEAELMVRMDEIRADSN